jgi:SAM-dependent methyltransferase
MQLKKIKSKFVKLFYADHNQSRIVKKIINECLSQLGDGEFGINIGAGSTNLHKRVRNLDIFEGENIYYVAKAESIPEKSDFFNLAISQEVLEHVENPELAVREIYRVLKVGGIFYCQLPFIIGYHPGPNDYWRFTKEGIIQLLEKEGFIIEDIGISVGGATGYYRISVEFFAGLFSIFIPKIYHIVKAIFSIFLFPIKYLDLLFVYSVQKDRIPGGYYVLAKKWKR